MLPLNTIRELFDYNYWARDRQLEACGALTPDQFVRPMGSSYASIRDTLAHLMGAEWVWLERWKGNSPTRADVAPNRLSPELFPTLESLQQRWQEVEREVRLYLSGLRDEKLAEPLSYVNFAGQNWSYPLWKTLVHVVNHGTYHRGQVTTLLRQLGARPAGLDLLVGYDQGFRS